MLLRVSDQVRQQCTSAVSLLTQSVWFLSSVASLSTSALFASRLASAFPKLALVCASSLSLASSAVTASSASTAAHSVRSHKVKSGHTDTAGGFMIYFCIARGNNVARYTVLSESGRQRIGGALQCTFYFLQALLIERGAAQFGCQRLHLAHAGLTLCFRLLRCSRGPVMQTELILPPGQR